MEQSGFKVYGYRWVVLLAFMGIIALNQLLWITFAAITTDAMQFYAVSDLSIGLLSLIFMVVYIFVSFPASWVIDTYGIRLGVGIGAILTGLFGLVRGLGASNYTWVLAAQIGIAVGQPFIMNAITTIAARWFPASERGTASGIGSLAMYLGILLGVALTPYLALRAGIPGMLTIYGVASVVAMLVFLLFSRERPPTPPCPPDQESRSLVLDGLNKMIRQRDFIFLMIIFFVGLGAFNAVTTWIEQILSPRHFSATQAGDAGGMMIFGGILGAVIIPLLSDKYRKRAPFLVLAVLGAAIGLAGVTYVTSYPLLLVFSFIFGGSLGFRMELPYMGALRLGKPAIAFKVKVETLKQSCGSENTITTSLCRFDLIVQALYEAAAKTTSKVVEDFVEPVIERGQELIKASQGALTDFVLPDED